MKKIFLLLAFAGCAFAANAQTPAPAENPRPKPPAQTPTRTHHVHEVIEFTRTVTTHRYQAGQYVPTDKWVCPRCHAGFVAEGHCPAHQTELVQQGTYYCPNHPRKQNENPRNCPKCHQPMVVSWPEKQPDALPAKPSEQLTAQD